MSRSIALMLSLAALGALAGCGSSDALNPDVVAQAADRTAAAGGARLTLTVAAQGQNLTGTGFLDTKGRKGRMHFQLPQNAGAMDLVFVNRVLYMHLPAALTKQLPGGRPWLKLDLEKALRKQGVDLGSLQSTSNTDPTQVLDNLRGAGDVKRVGDEKVRGTPTTHYKATIDLRKAAEKAPAAQRDAARRSVEQLEKLAGTTTIPAEVWIDKQSRLRRMSIRQNVKGQPFAMTMDLYDFGAREAIKPPPASQTKDITDTAGKQPALG
jgi:hypothetical protein